MNLMSQGHPIHYAIIGNSAAGITAAKEIRRYDPEGRITMISDEPNFGYSRVLLPLYVGGKIRKRDMVLTPRSFYSSLKIRLLRGETAESIDPKNQRVHTQSDVNIPYDRLLVATGSSPVKLNIPGGDLQGIYPLRKLGDAEAIRADLSSSRGKVLVVGGGLVGVKSLEALISRKRKAHLVISSDRILSQMIDKTASDLFLDVFQRNGVTVHLHTDVQSFCGSKRLEGAILSDGTTVSCDLAIIGKGVRPNVGPLKGTGVTLDQGIIVDCRMATGLPSVYAAGDVAEVLDLLEGRPRGNAIWPLAVEGGRVAGANMTGVSAALDGGLRMNSIEVLGTRVISAGEREGTEQLKALKKEGSVYRKLVFGGGRLRGFILAGDIRCAGVLTSLVKNRTEVAPSLLEEGLDRGFSYWPRLQALAGDIQVRENGRRSF